MFANPLLRAASQEDKLSCMSGELERVNQELGKAHVLLQGKQRSILSLEKTLEQLQLQLEKQKRDAEGKLAAQDREIADLRRLHVESEEQIRSQDETLQQLKMDILRQQQFCVPRFWCHSC